MRNSFCERGKKKVTLNQKEKRSDFSTLENVKALSANMVPRTVMGVSARLGVSFAAISHSDL